MATYKAEVKILLREGILDVQGKAIETSLHSLDFPNVSNIRVGKIITIDVDANSEDDAKMIIDKASQKLLANTIIEDYFITIK
jgi:phosphoribosylformylglycinamidine synthase